MDIGTVLVKRQKTISFTHQHKMTKIDNPLIAKTDKEILKAKPVTADKPVLGISKNKVVTLAELCSKRAKAYEFIL